MATKMYFHDAAPAEDPGETTRSVVLPAHTDNSDFGIPVKSMNTTIGTSQVQISGSTIATLNDQDNFFTSFSSPPIEAITLISESWTIAVEVSEGNNSANSRIVLSVYVFRPSTSSVVGFVYDSDTPLATEWNNGVTIGEVSTFTTSEVVASDNDIIVLEFWQHAFNGQAMAMSYIQKLDYDGTMEPLQAQNAESAASYVLSPRNIGFAPGGAASHPYIPQIKRTVRSRIVTR